MKLTLAPNEFLDDYILGCEFAKNAKISSNAYLFWKNIIYAKFENSRVVFLNTKTIPSKYKDIANSCTSLNGLVLTSTFCSFTGLAPSHLVSKNGSKIYNIVELHEICGIKFINLKKFYDDLGLEYSYRIYIEKCKYFSPTPFEKRIKITDTLCLGYY
ncbi:cysteine permease [Campylobacter sp. faydin G-24]|uniref:Cysteine permease n=1 Tax=Campylobacter anatolicus TaxID=2829105 RepID=A0ABS5HKA2_9BACT|nr:cysteine permease [Campylobacter anatolicus]MBR8461239.1 cysteine permease [Campylobacter anatolicus]MBR8464703.1 cysteine permease [Campylobacter anatolicus]MBR8466469.1 cysteine permease [Campylobacter anatolicus]